MRSNSACFILIFVILRFPKLCYFYVFFFLFFLYASFIFQVLFMYLRYLVCELKYKNISSFTLILLAQGEIIYIEDYLLLDRMINHT